MNLNELGWNPFFEALFNEYKNQGYIPARVFREHKSMYEVFTANGELTASLAGKLRHQAISKSEFPVVGDWVVLKVENNDQMGIISAVLPRKTTVVRKASTDRKREGGGALKEQVIAANIDMIFIVSGLDQDYNIRRIERYLTLVYDSGATPVIVLNKADLYPDVQSRIAEVEEIAFGIPIHAFCALHPEELTPLNEYFSTGKTVALLGSSGVGKSTIINSLLGYERQNVESISQSVGKGKHTTTHRELIFLPGGGIIMDNPGMREIQLITEMKISDDVFQEIEELAENCRFKDCQHISEPGCAVIAAIEDGTLDEKRYESYLKMHREIKYLDERRYKSANIMEKEKWQSLMKDKFKKKNRHKDQ